MAYLKFFFFFWGENHTYNGEKIEILTQMHTTKMGRQFIFQLLLHLLPLQVPPLMIINFS